MQRLIKLALVPAVLLVAALTSAPSTAQAGYGYGYGYGHYGYRSHYVHRVYTPIYVPVYNHCAPVYYGYGY